MKRLLLTMLLAVCLPVVSGCAMCCGPFDYAYPTYGGKWERGDRFWGRVGSPLSGAGTPIDGVGEIADPALPGYYSESAPVYDGVMIDSYPLEEYQSIPSPR